MIPWNNSVKDALGALPADDCAYLLKEKRPAPRDGPRILKHSLHGENDVADMRLP